jgi:mRNA interferase MazF
MVGSESFVLPPKGLPVTGAILSDQVKSLDWRARHAEFICELAAGVMNEALDKIATLLARE